jgi:DNA-binding transcriptional ArsR family regulator
MIEIVLANTDLARVRFAHSPVEELVASLRVLHDPGRQQLHGRWLSAVQGRLRGLRLDLLTALAPTGRYLPAFLLPAPTGPWPALADQLAAVAATPPAAVRAELDKVRDGGPLPSALRPLYEDPAAHLPTVVQELQRYWQVAIEPMWERLRALYMADLTYRMEQFASSGLGRVLDDLHPDVALERGDLLQIRKPHHCHHHVDLAGAGVLLVPCVFTWPTLGVGCCGVDQPWLVYPPRGVAALWREPPAARSDPLAALVGRTRATVLASVDLPRTTSQLAEQLGLSPASVSQHLKILKETALVSSRRRGRMVLYQQTAAATALLAAVRPRLSPGGG